jgi:transcriptional regulator with GAF, ATPase, and Fis domain
MKSVISQLRDTSVLNHRMIGESPGFAQIIQQLPLIARSNAAVLISGETGTGKELVARAIHYLSDRAEYPFIPVNCGSLPDTLLEDELFGHERGAFTGADLRRQGLIAQAHKGTLFLDEVDTLSPKAQVSLLRVLQDKRFRAIGSSCEQQVDVRIVAATNAKFDHLLQTNVFRSDLYYRLSIFSLVLPPLRERRDDILILANHFLHKHALAEKADVRFSADASTALLNWDWPGNIRELENMIIRAMYLCPGTTIRAEDLEPLASATAALGATPLREERLLPFQRMKQSAIASFEREYLTRLMTEHHGNVSQAARTAGKERRDLGKLLKKYQLNPRQF